MKETIHLIGNAHIDIFWLWKWEEGLQEIRATFKSALDRIGEHKEFVFTAAGAYYYSLVEETDPALFERIREAVKAGRWRIVGGWWLQPDCNAPAGESFARHGLYAQRYFKEKFGVTAKMGYNVDSFGHNGNLPQLYKKAGMDSYVFMRPMAHEKTLPRALFNWEGVDGSKVLAFRLLGYGSGGSEEWGEKLAAHIRRHIEAAEKEGTPFMCFYGVGNHGGGPTKQNLKTIDELKGKGENLLYSDPQRYFEEAAKQPGIPVVKDEMQYHAIGCYSSISKLKQANNATEQNLLFAEKMLAVTGGGDAAENAKALAAGWKKILANQFHDSLGGCSIPEAYPKILAAYAWGQETANQMTAILFQRLTSKIASFTDGTTVVFWNPHPWEVKGAMEYIGVTDAIYDSKGNQIPFELAANSCATAGFYSQTVRFNAVLPPLGYTSFKMVNYRGSLNSDEFSGFQYTRTATNHIESGDWDAVIDRETGFITSLYNKKTKTEYLGGQGIGPVIVDDESDTWTHVISSYQGARRKMALESYTLVSKGPVAAEYEIVYKLFDSTVILRVILNGELGTLDLKTRVIWNEHHRLLKLRVGSVFTKDTFVSEIPYGAIERRADGAEWPIQRWACLSDGKGPGLAVINNGVYSASAESGSLDLTLLRSPVYAHHENHHPRPDIEQRYVDQGENEYHIRVLPLEGAGQETIARKALELNQPAISVIESAHAGDLPLEKSFCGIKDGTSAVITTIKRGEDGDGWIIRAVETGGKNTSAAVDFAWLGVSGTFSFGPYEIKTIKIADKDKSISETNLLEY
jgi:alpha-mannosidase